MDSATRKTLTKAIMTIVGILLAALMGWLAGCSFTKDGDRWQVDAFYPKHQIDVHVQPASAPADPDEISP